jgi:hypothetical protein
MLLPRRAACSFNETYDHPTMGAPRGRESEHGVTNDEWIWPRFDDFASPLCRSATEVRIVRIRLGPNKPTPPRKPTSQAVRPDAQLTPAPESHNSISENRFDQAVVALWLNEARDQPQRRS